MSVKEEHITQTTESPWVPTTSQLAYMQREMAAQFPHLNVSVEMHDARTIYIEALPHLVEGVSA